MSEGQASFAGIDASSARTTISDVARHAGVSTSSVSRHLKGLQVTGAERIATAVQELGFHPSSVARWLKSGKTFTLGLVVPDVTNPFFAGVVKGVESVAHTAGYTVLLCNTDESADREHSVVSTLMDRVDGLILAPARDDAETADSLAALGIPVVLIDRTLRDPGPADVVLVDNAGGASAAAVHLLDLGHRRIGLISGPVETTPGAERHQGFLDVCGDPVTVLIEMADFRESGGYQAAMRLFGRSDPPTAVFAANNMMTVGLLRALHDLGQRIPTDVSVVGFDDHPLGDLLDPPLTVVDRPTENQGAVAARMLLARLADANQRAGRVVRLETKLVIRSSTGTPAGDP